ncbi:peptide deformylase [candidate division WWE3 bacterium]|nr:peptide deformylase [candidate division WWE3 bacterium]
MPVCKIVTIPDEVLLTPTKKIVDFNIDTQELIKNLLDTVRKAKDPEGAGLAAPQIGISKRACVVRDFFVNPMNRDEVLSHDYVLINPKIISASKETELDIEGCLSIPLVYGKVERAKKVKIKALNEHGEEIRFMASGFLARVVQHEIDHLDGILFTSKLVGRPYTEEELEEIESKY